MGDRPRYKRILLKLSGEVLMGGRPYGIDPETVERLCSQLKRLHKTGLEIGLVVGGGNIFRGMKAAKSGMDRVTADNMGMLATVINSLSLQDRLEKLGVPTRVMSAVRMDTFAERYIRRRAVRHLEKGRLIILAAGTGNPFFTTDTAASLRAIEIGAEVILKGTKVDGVFSADPVTNKEAVFHHELSYHDVITRELAVMDTSSIALCKENNLPIVVFNVNVEDNLYRACMGEQVGTLVH